MSIKLSVYFKILVGYIKQSVVNTRVFLSVLSEWCDGSLRTGPPDQQFVWDGVLQGWCRQAWWMEEVLGELRAQLGPQLQRVSLLAMGRALGRCCL